MKIVINACFGGFGLSPEAEIKLHKLGCSHTKTITQDTYFNITKDEGLRKEHIECLKIPVLKNGDLIVDNHREYKARTCKNLIKVVKEMGEKANGKYSKLKIVKIPDGIKWDIDEYDGFETIEEEHRSWG